MSVERLLETIQGWREEGLGWCPDIERTNYPDAMRDIFEAAAAVPVVHPEPGDREQRWIETLSTRLKRSSPDWPQRLNYIRACMDMADAEVAAAVAAVRADLADQIARMPQFSRSFDAARYVRTDLAAALVAGDQHCTAEGCSRTASYDTAHGWRFCDAHVPF